MEKVRKFVPKRNSQRNELERNEQKISPSPLSNTLNREIPGLGLIETCSDHGLRIFGGKEKRLVRYWIQPEF